MKNLILIIAFLTLPLVGFAQTEKPVYADATELVVLKKAEKDAPRKARASRNATHIFTAPTPEELKTLILEFLNTNLTILEPGSIVSSNTCIGSIQTTAASYCP